MDIEESYEQQQTASTASAAASTSTMTMAAAAAAAAGVAQGQQQDQQQLMQCEPIFGSTTNNVSVVNSMPIGSALLATPPPVPRTPPTTPVTNNSSIGNAKAIQANNFDIDPLLLQQFSCMGTTDHDDLITQFQSLMNYQMNRDSSRFYLEMSNWNLQMALGCYLDFCSTQSMPSMKIIESKYITELQYVFRLQNDGTDRWPNNCMLTSPVQLERFIVPTLRPGEYCDIHMDLLPEMPPIVWRLAMPNGWCFGDAIWLVPLGLQATQAELHVRMTQLVTSEDCSHLYPQVKITIATNSQ